MRKQLNLKHIKTGHCEPSKYFLFKKMLCEKNILITFQFGMKTDQNV